MSRSPIQILTVLVVGAFLVLAIAVSTPAERPQDYEKRIMARVVEDTPEPPQLSDAKRALQNELRAIGEGFEGAAGIAVAKTSDLAIMSYQGATPFPQQSVSKLWVAMTALDLSDKGALSLDEMVTIRRQDLTVFYQPIRDIVKRRGVFTSDYRDLLDRAITQSDNTANDRLLRRIGGPKAVEGFLRRNRIEGVRFGTDERNKQSAIAGLEWRQAYSSGNAFYEARDRVPEEERRQAFETYLSDPIDGATPNGIAKALARLARGDLLSPASTDLLLATLKETKSGPKRLKGGVPDGWTFGHKTGTGQYFDGVQSGYNDVGILTAPDGTTYTIAVLIGRTTTPYAARFEMMQSVTRAVVSYHEGLQAYVASSAVGSSTHFITPPARGVQYPMRTPDRASTSPTHWLQVFESV